MPYIAKKERERLSNTLRYLVDDTYKLGVGELNYLFTSISKLYLENSKERYQTYNDIVGALECCKLEIYRRKISKYEDSKIVENGDVF